MTLIRTPKLILITRKRIKNMGSNSLIKTNRANSKEKRMNSIYQSHIIIRMN